MRFRWKRTPPAASASPRTARARAEDVIRQAVQDEIRVSGVLTDPEGPNRAYMELKAKEHAGYNACWRYHCTYQKSFGANPQRLLHPAYQ